ncbi:MAG: sugar ABC transporter ATP-binding protein [Vallitaleaceae bacterium]|nr:sugar ABC transporter ATP-binding protein [Vallitaleaceae bacterium]
MEGVSKRFPGTLAVNNVDFEVYAGEVHALLGENGAGKSTLMKMLAGSYSDYTGKIFINTKEVQLHSPATAKAEGIAMIYQELSLALPRSIAENILAGHLPGKGLFVNKKRMMTRAKNSLKKVGLEYLDPNTPVKSISQHEAQLVEIAKALDNTPCILVMDEPTSALSSEEVNRLYEIIRNLKKAGLAIVYISHHLPEIFNIADRVTVMRDGQKIGTYGIDEVNQEKLVELMVGLKADEFYQKHAAKLGEEVLSVKQFTRYGFFHNVSFNLRKGEILGVGGLAGAGRSELARAIVGADAHDGGEVCVEGKVVKVRNMSQMLNVGIAYLSENRKTQGLSLRLTNRENILAAMIKKHSKGMVYFPDLGKSLVEDLIEELKVYPPDPNRTVGNLSGGNQQKVLLAKWLATNPKVLILDEPTRGVDVGAKKVIHEAIERLAQKGVAIILISSDLPELVTLSDRVMIIRQGHLVGEIEKDASNEETVLLAANGNGGVLSVQY